MTARPPDIRLASLAAYAASAAVALAYGVVLPVLPAIVATPSPARMTAELMAVYSAAVVVTAPAWGRLCGRVPTHRLVQVGLLGQAASLGLLLLPPTPALLLVARGLQGVFASAVVPALQAHASREASSESSRSQRLADLSRAALVGGLFGPGIGGVVGGRGLVGPALVAIAALAIATLLQRASATPTAAMVPTVATAAPPRRSDVAVLLGLAALAAAAMSVYEVGLATRARLVDGLSAREVGFMFTGCGVVMLLSQSLVFRPRHDPQRAFGWVGPSFIASAAGLALLSWMVGTRASVAGVVLVAASAGVLQPSLTYWTSRAAGAAEATSLGWRASVTTGGQALGSMVGGLAFGATTAGRASLAALLSALLIAAAVARARRQAPAGIPRMLGSPRT